MKNKKSYLYPWRYNNQFQVLIDGVDYFSSMLNEIKKSKIQILNFADIRALFKMQVCRVPPLQNHPSKSTISVHYRPENHASESLMGLNHGPINILQLHPLSSNPGN